MAVEFCSHTQAYAAGETDETVFNRAANAINAGGPCQRAGVRAAVACRAEAGDLEDQEPVPGFDFTLLIGQIVSM